MSKTTTTSSPSLATTVAGIRMETCVYNASGPRTGSSAAMSKIAGGVLAKSATLASQEGNPLPRTWHDTDGGASLNSEGLPNAGIDYYIDKKTIEDTIGDYTYKPYMVSISGATLDDNLKMLQKILDARQTQSAPIAAVELNLACPNVIGKPIIGYDFDQMHDVLQKVCNIMDGKTLLPLGLKLPPYLDGPLFDRAASIINEYKDTVAYVACINTIGNALAVNAVSEAPCIRSKGGLAGLSGRAVKYTALANVRQFRLLLDDSIDVVGVGGISSGTDVFEMLLCGATAVQVGTCHWTEGPKCFDRICDELRDILDSKCYSSVQDVIGKLQPWTKEGASKARAAAKREKEKEEAAAKEATNNSKENLTTIWMDFYMMTSLVLLVVVAVLLGDKYGVLTLEE